MGKYAEHSRTYCYYKRQIPQAIYFIFFSSDQKENTLYIFAYIHFGYYSFILNSFYLYIFSSIKYSITNTHNKMSLKVRKRTPHCIGWFALCHNQPDIFIKHVWSYFENMFIFEAYPLVNFIHKSENLKHLNFW